jgi:hypothetical protein
MFHGYAICHGGCYKGLGWVTCLAVGRVTAAALHLMSMHTMMHILLAGMLHVWHAHIDSSLLTQPAVAALAPHALLRHPKTQPQPLITRP